MRWSVEVTSGEKTDLQKYVVDAESWQRALQAARAQRGEQGPMSGFSIELLDEGYRAVDPVTRNKFVVKRAPDDAPLTVPAAAASASAKDSKAPAAPRAMKAPAPLPSKTSVPPAAKSTPSVPPAAKSGPSVPPAAKSTPSVPPAPKSIPPRPGDSKKDVASAAKKSRAERKSEKMKAAAAKKDEARHKSAVPPPVIEPEEVAPNTDAQPEPPRPPADSIQETPLLPIGAFVPGLPSVKLMTSREQDPSDASPLAYREYAFSTKEGTSEEVGEKILRAQLKLVQAHMEKLKQGKLVNLAVFDGTFEGKPTVPPLCTLAWKDWKGEPVIAFPRRSGAAKPVKPPTSPTASGGHSPMMPPASMPPNPPPAPTPAAPVVNMPPGYSAPPPAASTTQPIQPSALPRPPGAIAAMVNAAKAAPEPEAAPAPPNPLNQTVKDAVNPFAVAPSAAPPANPFAPAANPFAPAPSAPPASGAPVGPGTSPLIPAAAPVAAAPSAPPPPPAPSVPPPAAASFPPPAMGSVHPPATFQPQAPVPITTAQPSSPPARRSSTPDGVVRTPSGRFVRGRVTGDELITELFESMHDLHFLRDALDGGQFCLALAMEVIPVRAAIIHFFDIEKREWIVACTRGKDAGKLLTTRTPETDDLLRAAARHRRAIVTPNGAHAQAQRYQSIGGARSIIIAPIMQAGRALGAIEMINPADGMPFNEDEGNAMTYIAEQYAEYLGSRGIVVHPDRIRAAANV
jgi:hypothetical protein